MAGRTAVLRSAARARYVASEDLVIGVTGCGASAPAERLHAEFGITKDVIIARAKQPVGI